MENDEILTRDYILNLEEDILTKIIAINEINKEVLIRYLNESEFLKILLFVILAGMAVCKIL